MGWGGGVSDWIKMEAVAAFIAMKSQNSELLFRSFHAFWFWMHVYKVLG